MWLSEKALFLCARFLYRSPLCHTPTMKEAMADSDKFDSYRANESHHVLRIARRFGFSIQDKKLLDFGCGTGGMTRNYLDEGARQVIGIDIDDPSIARAQKQFSAPGLEFIVSGEDHIPLDDASVDAVISFDAFEHVTQPARMIAEIHRVLKPGGEAFLDAWTWYHPFAPHLFATMPVPWAHVIFSERTIMRTCRRVYDAPWYVPNAFDLDGNGQRKARYLQDEIPLTYVNKLLVRDFERILRASPFEYELHLIPFGSKYARWTRVFHRIPWLREFFVSEWCARLRRVR